MPTFIKLKIPGRPYCTTEELKQDSYIWKLIIKDLDEFKKFAGYDGEAVAHAYLSLAGKNERGNFTHLGPLASREMVLGRYLSSAVHYADGEKIYPLLEVAKVNDLKQEGMVKALLRGETLAINSNGMGWCTLDSFMKIWNCEVLEVREKEGFGFPIELESEEYADTVALENATNEHFTKKCIEDGIKKSIPDPGTVAIIFNLKETDEKYIFKMLQEAKNIYIRSSFEDPKQIKGMGKMFMLIPQKNVYIETWTEGKKNLTQHPIYDELNKKHTIKFI